LQNLIAYNKVLSQRNSLLKYFAANQTFDNLNLDIYNKQMVEIGREIHKKRIEFSNNFEPIFQKRYRIISNDMEKVGLLYKTHLKNDNFEKLLQENLKRDRLLQFTSVGVHRDDLLYTIGGYPIKKFGSQGQQKTYLIALKLAEFDFVKAKSKLTPILLLDDIFDKLDEKRVAQIIDLVNDNNFGQIFISDTHADRTENVIKKTKQPYKMIVLE
jgi:DNA replication and repair protein RecF